MMKCLLDTLSLDETQRKIQRVHVLIFLPLNMTQRWETSNNEAHKCDAL